jgi:hypothetical protein
MTEQKCEILPEMDKDWIYLFYCKCRKSKGNPIIIKANGTEYYADKVLFRDIGDMELEFNNSPKKIAQRGATTVLKFKKAQYDFRCIDEDSVYEIKGTYKKNFVIEK